ncbi:beta-ketoacyl-[acyl-carrier-protein] synthase family protein [Nonomuraea sp. NPDC049400]|uniref:beta-ketoacyl-[acyl-carrier-protein] synthase family protein n=1 Tax=Nonomuraea sp. NPDC049400 TaxID=3364352 RepID=UPI00379C60F4
MASNTRVAVTGLGVRTPAGHHAKDLWETLAAGRSTARIITSFAADGLPVNFACQVGDPKWEEHVTVRQAHRMDRTTLLAVCAAADAVTDAGELHAPPERRAVMTGTGQAGNETYEQAMLGHGEFGNPTPLTVPKSMHNAAAAWISMRHQVLGPSLTVSSACASGGHAIGEGLRLIRDGSADVVVAGGAEACVSPSVLLAFHRCGALSRRVTDPERASRPFDIDRDGFVMAEGAAFVVLERLEAARRRGARVYAELAGYGRTSDAYHLTMPVPDGGGAERCMRQALTDARLSPGHVVHVNAHGTGTPLNDLAEAQAISRVFGPGQVPVTSTKSVIGHALGAAGAIEAVVSALTVFHGAAHPTANLDTLDPGCDIDVVRAPRALAPGAVLSNSFAFGGHNASLVFTPSGT